MSEIAVVVEFQVKPERRRDFEAVIREHARKTKETEPGCRRFDVLIPQEDDGRVLLFECYANTDAFKHHGAQPRLQEVRKSYEDMVTGRKLTVCTLG